jgi:hypothetical protein
MTEQHPITPPPKLVEKWIKSARYREFMPYPEGYEQYEQRLTTIAARWGADQELEACCEWFVRDWTDIETADKLRAARRPKPQTLNSIALQMLGTIERDAHYLPEITDTIRRALEALPND